MKSVVVIMAGGRGERFWPKSRQSLPKQFLSLTSDGKTMIQHTVERVKSLIEMDDIFIVTNKSYKHLVEEQLPDLPKENILLEPMAKNTAPCIGLATMYIKKKYGNAIMIVLPSDHLVKYNEIFIDSLNKAINVAEHKGNMVTIGITPSYPEIGYGYINFEKSSECDSDCYIVKQFVEKPNLQKAKEYLASGRYLWNSGMFVWRSDTILNNIQIFLPDMYKGLIEIEKAIGLENENDIIKEVFLDFNSESIDYGIMEKADRIYTISGNFGWDDVGSWLALERINKTNEDENLISGNVVTINTKNTIIQGTEKLIAAVGLQNIVIVDTEDALLICDRESTQDIKKVIENLKICNRIEYL